MRIIDKNHDFYDYLQDPTDDRIIFDRRNSFLLEKKHICDAMHVSDINRYCTDNKYWQLNLQCGASFWMFLLTATEYGGEYIFPNVQAPINYDIELLASWKNYNVPSKIIDICVDSYHFGRWDWKTRKVIYSKDDINPNTIKSSFNYNSMGNSVTSLTVTRHKEIKTYNIPLLRACGVANLISPVDVFCSIEEHFSREKTAAERTEPLGATNNDKIIMHGFDTKTSFRGKNS